MDKLEAFFVCPMCRGALAREEAALACRECPERYRLAGDIPIMVPQGREPVEVPDPGIPFEMACELAAHLSRLDGSFGNLVDAYYEHLRGCHFDPHLFDYYRDITKSRQVAQVSEEVCNISTAMELLYCIIPPVRLAVEFGCGWGFSLAALARSRRLSPALQHATLCGFDLNPSILAVAQRLFRDMGLDNIQLAVADARLPLPFRPRSVDLIYSNGVVEHVLEQDALMRNLSDALSDESVLHFLIPNRYMIHPEPHYNVRGVGFVPRKLQPRYVGWRLGLPTREVGEILSYTPTDLAGLLDKHFPHEFHVVIPSRPPIRNGLTRTLACRTLGLLAVNSYHCVVRRMAGKSELEDYRGLTQLVSILSDGRPRITEVLSHTPARAA